MKVAQLRKVLEAAEQLYRDNGQAAAASSLRDISTLLSGRDAMTVARFASLLAKAAGGQQPAELN
jgi:hypothetical protein